ncbi:acyl carrier protein [Neobacillus sp.]|uniref:acyl carrier protein n=1 Tax=Neobacillus sp. TaxID=2675273 RepID=UPI0028A20A95|nr:acyl carrier protein [Neobacillus sp.]
MMVEMENFLAELADLLEIEKSDLTSGYLLEENENWDSLAFISVIVMVDENFQLTISNAAIRKCICVGELLKLIKDKRELVGS